MRLQIGLLVVFLAALAPTRTPAEVPLPVISLPGSTAVGRQSATLTVPVTMTQAGSATNPVVVTQGQSGLDFQAVPGGTCESGASYTAGQECTVNVVFSPRYPGLRSGAVILESTSGTVLGLTLINGTGTGGLSVLVPGTINTVAGNAEWIYNGDGALATQSSIFLPMGVTEDAAGNLFLSDTNNNRIRRVDAATGVISTVGGTGSPGYNGDGGLATAAEVNTPAGIVLDGAGDLYFADTGNHVIRRIDAVTRIITTVAGTPTDQGYTGDGGAATHATLSLPEGLAFDSAQNLYIADTGNNVVRRVSATTGIVTTIAGTGVAGYSGDGGAATSAELNSPWSVAIGTTDGLLYIADLTNNVVRKVSSSGTITTVVGNGTAGFSGDGGIATSAQLNEPASVVFDPGGNMYIGDSGNNRVRQVLANSEFIQTLVGTGNETFSGDMGGANMAGLYGTYALYLDQSGNLLVADMFHNRIREVYANSITISYPTMRVDRISAPTNETVANDGNAGLTFAAATLNQSALSASETTCTSGTVLAATTSCTVGVEFAPTTVGDPVAGTLGVNSNASNSPGVITLLGQVLSVNPTSVGLTSSQNPSLYGNYVTFTAVVASAGSGLTGTITFFDGTTQLCSSAIENNTVYCGTASLTVGQHSITASYSGDTNDAASLSAPLTQVVQQTPALTLSASPNPAIAAGTVVLTANVTGSARTPTGTVTFYDGSTALGTAALSSSGTASLSTASLAAGTHNLSVTYSGDTFDATVTSDNLKEVVELATTVTTASTSDATVTAGTSVTVSAQVSSTNGPMPAGTVVFKTGTTVLGTATLSSAGTASLVLPSLPVGSYSIVATYGGDSDDAGSASTTLSEVVRQIATTTTAVSSSNPASAGAVVNFTASVGIAAGAVADGSITGTVTFMDGTATIGTVPLNSAGQAVLAVSALNAGTHSIVATYNGSTNYAISSSAGISEKIDNTATETAISASASAVRAGQAVTFSIAVSSATGVPTGTVTIYDGSVSIGQAALNAKGLATFATSSLPVGTHSLTAVYAGDPNYLTSTSAVLQESVSIGITALTLAGPSAVDYGAAVNLVATLTTNGVAPTGALTLRDGATLIATQSISGAGSFTFSTSSLPVGIHTLTAAYAGDSDNAAALSAALTLTVQQGPTTTAFTTSANPSTLGKSLTLSASVTSVSPNVTGSVSFEDGGTVLGSASLVNGAATFSTASLGFGPHNLTAVYSGDTDHVTSTSTAIAEQIVEPATAALTSSYNPSVSGANVTFTAKIAGVGTVIPTGSVVFSDGSATLGTVPLDAAGAASFQTSSLSVGSHSISMTYAGDKNYSSASASLIQTVQDASTQMSLTAGSNPSTYGTPLSLTATIASNGGTATGSVTFMDGGVSIGSAVLNASGVATLTTSTLQPGAQSIVATYAGDGKASASVSTPLDVSVKQLTSVAVGSSANPAATLSPVTFTAAVTNSGVGEPTGAITFTDGATQLGVAMLNASGQASLTVPSLASGNHIIVASYAGDTGNFAGTSSGLSEAVQLRPTSTSVTASQTNASNPLQVTLIAIVRWTGSTTTPTGTVTFSDASGTLGSSTVDSTGAATLTVDLQAASESITATYSGDSAYATSASASTSVSGGVATQFTLAISPATATVQSAQHIVVALTATSLQGFTDTLQLGCLGLPYAATCTFSAPQTRLTANGTSTVQLTIDTSNPLGEGAQASARGLSGSRVMLCMLPGTLIASLLFFSRRRRRLLPLLLLICAVAMSLGATGCAGLQGNSTPVGSYTFRVTASGVGTGFTENQVMNLTVTQ